MVRRAPLILLLLAGCGGAAGSRSGGAGERVGQGVPAKVEPSRPSSTAAAVIRDEGKADPFHATSGPGDVPMPFVREERSSRLDVPLPKGRAKEAWRVPLGPPLREPCGDREPCPPLKAAAVLAAGNRVAVIGLDGWALFDTSGHRIDAAKADGASKRLDRASGLVVSDEARSADLPAEAKVAAKKGLVVMVHGGGIHVGERAIEGRIEALDVAIDDAGLACVLVRQGEDLHLWTVPLASGGGIGRQRISQGPRRVLGPPVLGKNLRVIVLDTSVIAFGADGKRLWERRGVPTGGVTITSDDHVLIADNGKVLAVDPRGRTTELYFVPDAIFVTPPILDARGVLFVASGRSLHAVSFF